MPQRPASAKADWLLLHCFWYLLGDLALFAFAANLSLIIVHSISQWNLYNVWGSVCKDRGLPYQAGYPSKRATLTLAHFLFFLRRVTVFFTRQPGVPGQAGYSVRITLQLWLTCLLGLTFSSTCFETLWVCPNWKILLVNPGYLLPSNWV